MTRRSAHQQPAVIIMAGGMGTRFWPASRELVPKQFLTICGSKSLLEECFLRIAPLTDPERIFVIINASHRSLTEKILGGMGVRIVEEPYGRNTAPCIGLGCIHVVARFGDLPIIALPADHFVSDVARYRRCLRRGLSLLGNGGIVTIGIPPTHPETGYGYIEKGPPLQRRETHRVLRFVEKPDLDRAKGFLASGNYLWNSGMFLFRAQTMLREIDTRLPKIGEGLRLISKALEKGDYQPTLEKAYQEMESVSIDYGVMERTAEPVYVVQGDFGWSDVGHWAAVRELRAAEQDEEGNVTSGKVVLLNTRNAFVHSHGRRLIGVLGLENVLIVDTDDALLVANLSHAQRVRRLLEIVRERGWSEYL